MQGLGDAVLDRVPVGVARGGVLEAEVDAALGFIDGHALFGCREVGGWVGGWVGLEGGVASVTLMRPRSTTERDGKAGSATVASRQARTLSWRTAAARISLGGGGGGVEEAKWRAAGEDTPIAVGGGGRRLPKAAKAADTGRPRQTEDRSMLLLLLLGPVVVAVVWVWVCCA